MIQNNIPFAIQEQNQEHDTSNQISIQEDKSLFVQNNQDNNYDDVNEEDNTFDIEVNYTRKEDEVLELSKEMEKYLREELYLKADTLGNMLHSLLNLQKYIVNNYKHIEDLNLCEGFQFSLDHHQEYKAVIEALL